MKYIPLIIGCLLTSCGIFKGPKQAPDRNEQTTDSLFKDLEESNNSHDTSNTQVEIDMGVDFFANEVLWLSEPFTQVIDMETDSGIITIALLDATPKHRDNFVKLADSGYFDGLLFHRVINQFVVQGGDPDSKSAAADKLLGDGGPGYEIDAEILPTLHHYRGAIGAARESDDKNPERKSSGSQFYFVTGKVQNEALIEMNFRKRAFYGTLFKPGFEQFKNRFDTLNKYKDTAGIRMLREEMFPLIQPEYERIKQLFPQEVLDKYFQYGGTPHLDGNYTVFGFVLSGYEVVERIQKTATNKDDRPVPDIRIIKARSRN